MPLLFREKDREPQLRGEEGVISGKKRSRQACLKIRFNVELSWDEFRECMQ